jgi:uncharacterized protein YbjT (DUF2867 family)
MATTVLVTGATGKTGRRLTPALRQRGITVLAASRTPTPARDGVQPVHFDWFDESTYAPALAGADAVYLVSPGPADGTADPIAQVGKFLHSAASFGVSKVVLLSSFGVDQAPFDGPLRQVELAVTGAGLPNTILRPAAFMQNFSENHWSAAARTIREQGKLVMPFGEHPVSYVSAGDIAGVAAAALAEDGHTGKEYTLTGPEALTLSQVAAHISAAAGRNVPYADPGPDVLRLALLNAGLPAAAADYISQAYAHAVTSGGMSAITSDVPDVTGRPATTFEDFASAAAGAWIA